jgi:hypothetical protein
MTDFGFCDTSDLEKIVIVNYGQPLAVLFRTIFGQMHSAHHATSTVVMSVSWYFVSEKASS